MATPHNVITPQGEESRKRSAKVLANFERTRVPSSSNKRRPSSHYIGFGLGFALVLFALYAAKSINFNFSDAHNESLNAIVTPVMTAAEKSVMVATEKAVVTATEKPIARSIVKPVLDTSIKSPCDVITLLSANTTKVLTDSSAIFASQPKCSRAGYTSGEWAFDPDLKSIKQRTGLDMDMGSSTSHRTKNIREGTDEKTGDYRPANWVWEPTNSEDKCVLEPFDAARWCAAVGYGKSVLFVGDSLTVQMVVQLRRQLSPTTNAMDSCGNPVTVDGDWYGSYAKGKEYYQTVVCPGGGRVSLSITHHLTIEDSSGGNCVDKCNPIKNWAEIVHDYDFLVLNAGIHIMQVPAYQSNMKKLGTFLRDHYKGKVFWRDTSAGNPGCQDYSRPIKAADFTRIPKNMPRTFGWQGVPQFNNIALVTLKKYLPDLVYLNTDPMTKLRADAHRDCLHFNPPSVPDYWVLLLYNYLIKNMKD